MAEENDKGFRALREEYNKKLADKLFQYMQAKGIQSSRIIENIREKYGEELNSGTISGYKNGKVQMPPIFIWEACKLIGMSADEIFQLVEDAMSQSAFDAKRQNNDMNETNKGQNWQLSLPASPLVSTDPNAPVFRGYWGNYYIYFTPTYSSGKGFLKGTMCISKGASDVHVKIELCEHVENTGRYRIEKVYEGILVHSAAVKCCYCILSSCDVGEMCFFMFRHFHLNQKELECRMAEVLTASAGGEDKTPTTHRMIITREEISDKDIFDILPLLNLNNSQITISKQALQQLAEKEHDYKEIIDCIINLAGTESGEYYRIRENVIRSAMYGFKNTSSLSFILSLRGQAIAPRYNKISKKADETLRTLLLEKGYYSPKNKP